MIKKALMLFLFCTVVLTACSDSELMNFVGESHDWEVKYSVTLLDENSESTHLTIKYIGEKPIPKKIKYVVETATGKSEGESPLENGALITGGDSCSGCAVTQKNEKITATITWNDESETIILKNN